MFASSRKTKLLAAAAALLAVIGLGPQQYDRVGETLKAARTTPPALIRPAHTREDVQAWILGAVPGDTTSNGIPSAGPGEATPAPGRPAEADPEA